MKNFLQILVTSLTALCLYAQEDGTIDNSFLANNNGQKGVNGEIKTIVQQTDGKLLIGGGFDTYNQILSPKLIRVNADGSIDTSFNQTLLRDSNTSVNSVILQPDGKILVAGDFEMRTPFPDNDLLEEDIMRLNADGTRDESFIASENTSSCGDITSIVLQPDGKIIVVGDIPYCVGSTIDNNENILRLNADGSLDVTFAPVITDLGFGFSEEPINTVVVQPDGKILIAGNFNEVNGVAQLRLARLNSDGTLDTSFAIGSGFNEVINDIILQPDGKLLVVGDFNEFNGTTHNQIVRLNSDGSLDLTFNSGDGVGRFQPSNGFTAPMNIEHVNIQSDGKILIGGDYNRYDGNPVSRFTRLNSNGTLDNSFFNVDDLGIEIAFISTSFILPNGDFVIGGNIDKHHRYRKSGIAKLNSSGQIDLTFNSGHGPTESYTDTQTHTIKSAAGNKLYVAGRFREYDDVFSRNIAKLNSDGSIDTSFSTGTDELINGFDDEVYDLVEQTDGKIVVVGEFENYNGNIAPGIARLNLDGSYDNTFAVGSGVDTANSNRINTIVELQNGQFLVGGFFTQFDGFTTRNLARLNSDGSIDTSFFVSNTSQVYHIHLLDNGQFFISVFSYNGDTVVGRLAKINSDGTRDVSFNATGITTGTTEIVKELDNNKLLVGGFYSSQGPILKLNSDGSLDNTFNAISIMTSANTTGRINDIELQANGKIIIGGRFTAIGGRTIRGVARLNSDGSFDDTFNPENIPEDPETYAGTDDFITSVSDLELRESGQLLVTGDFRSYNTEPKSPLIALFAGIPPTLSDNQFEFLERKITIFPNPASNVVSISSEKEIEKIQLYTISGKQILNQQELNTFNHSIDISQLYKGFYVLKISNDSTILTKKLVIN